MSTATRSEGISYVYTMQYLERWRSNGLSLTLQKNEDVPNDLFATLTPTLLNKAAATGREVKLLFAPAADGEHTLLTGRIKDATEVRVWFRDGDDASLSGLIAVFVR